MAISNVRFHTRSCPGIEVRLIGGEPAIGVSSDDNEFTLFLGSSVEAAAECVSQLENAANEMRKWVDEKKAAAHAEWLANRMSVEGGE